MTRTSTAVIDAEALARVQEVCGNNPSEHPDQGVVVRLGDLRELRRFVVAVGASPAPIPLRLLCPRCGGLHVDEGEFATKPHHTHACQFCGEVWRPAVVATVGVQFLPGFKNEEPAR